MTEQVMEWEWAIGRFEGKQAEWVESHSETSYYVLDIEGKGKSKIVVAAFRRPCDSPFPHHLDRPTSSQETALDERLKKRQGR